MSKKDDKPFSMQTISDLFRQAGLTGKTPVKKIPGESLWNDRDEQGNEFINREIKATPKTKKAVPDKQVFEEIKSCLAGDKVFDDKTGRIVLTRISGHCNKVFGNGLTNMEKGFRGRVKELLPYIDGVIKYNGDFFYKKSKHYKTFLNQVNKGKP